MSPGMMRSIAECCCASERRLAAASVAEICWSASWLRSYYLVKICVPDLVFHYCTKFV